jgi:hypothetical protein
MVLSVLITGATEGVKQGMKAYVAEAWQGYDHHQKVRTSTLFQKSE